MRLKLKDRRMVFLYLEDSKQINQKKKVTKGVRHAEQSRVRGKTRARESKGLKG